MRAKPWTPLLVLTGVVIGAACADSATMPPEGPGGTVALISPTTGAQITQNDASLGCPAHATRGYGFRLAFDWDDVTGAARYFVRLKRTGALYPAVDWSVPVSEFEGLWCNAFVTDANLTNWVWRVAAVAHGADSTAADTLWSEERTYSFLPCRISEGVPCTAPPDTSPPSDSL